MVVQKLSSKELGILIQATGWPKRYRNHYVCVNHCGSCETANGLVAKGILYRYGISWIPVFLYTVTKEGFKVLENLENRGS